MELCGPNMHDSGGPLCRVKHLPHHSTSLCRLQAGRPGTQNLPHQPWVNQPLMAVASSPAVVHAHRANGAVAPSFSSQEGTISRAAEEAAMTPRGLAAGRVLVTGGAGYFGSRLGRELAGQGMSVILLDVNKPPCDVPDGATYYQVQICLFWAISLIKLNFKLPIAICSFYLLLSNARLTPYRHHITAPLQSF